MFTELRDQLIHDLTTGSDGAADPVGVSVYEAWPERFAPPGLLVTTPRSGSYIAQGANNIPGTYEVSLDVWVVVRQTNPAQALRDIEALVEIVLQNTIDWAFRGVDSVALTNIGADYPATIIHLAKTAKL